MTQTSRILLVHLNTGATHTREDNTINSRLSKSLSFSSSSSSSSFDGQEDNSMLGAERVGARMHLGSNEDPSYGEICTSTEVPQWGIHTGQVNVNLSIELLLSLLSLLPFLPSLTYSPSPYPFYYLPSSPSFLTSSFPLFSHSSPTFLPSLFPPILHTSLLPSPRPPVPLLSYLTLPLSLIQILAADMARDRPILVTVSSDSSLRIWNYEIMKCEVMHVFKSDEPVSVAIHSSGRWYGVV